MLHASEGVRARLGEDSSRSGPKGEIKNPVRRARGVRLALLARGRDTVRMHLMSSPWSCSPGQAAASSWEEESPGRLTRRN